MGLLRGILGVETIVQLNAGIFRRNNAPPSKDVFLGKLSRVAWPGSGSGA